VIWERPNTVAGPIEESRKLAGRLRIAQIEIKTPIASIDTIDMVLKLFAQEISGADAKPMQLPIPHAARRCEMTKTALTLLRETGAPVISTASQ
jgi:hypothetical protein